MLVLLVAALVVLIGIGLAFHYSKSYLWLAAFGSWVFSFLGSFSIGLYTLVITFVLLMLAIGFSAGWIKSGLHEVLAVVAGVALWVVAINTVDDFWLFFPISAIGLLDQ